MLREGASTNDLSSFAYVKLSALHIARYALRAYGSHASHCCSASRRSCIASIGVDLMCVKKGLKMRSAHTAKTRALVAAAKLDEYWSHLRMTDPDLIRRNLLKPGFKFYSRNTLHDVSTSTKADITLYEALETYLVQKGANKGKTFHAAAQRACAYLVEACGAKDLADYTRTDALKYRDYLIAKGMAGSSVSRVISSIRAVMNFAISEYALELKNPFIGMYHDRLAGVSKRLPIPIEDIRKVQQQCLSLDDDLRWLVALVSDTGMRLAEVAGLLKSDIILDADMPFIRLQPHPWRKLKTSGSVMGCAACRRLSMGCSEAVRGLFRQRVYLP